MRGGGGIEERERERERNEIDIENEKVVGDEAAAASEDLTGERKEVEKGDNLNEETNLPLEVESGKTSEPLSSPSGEPNVNLEKEKEQWLLGMIDFVFNAKLEKGDYQCDKESWKVVNNYNRGIGISVEDFINENFTKNSEEFKNLKEKLAEVIKKLEELGVSEENQEKMFTRLLQAKYKGFAEEENFTPAEEDWTWFGGYEVRQELIFSFQTSIQEIKNPERKTRLTNLLSETKENLKQLGEKYRYIKGEIQRLYDWLVENASASYNDDRNYWKILDKFGDKTSYLSAVELIDKEIGIDTELNKRLKNFLAESQRNWREETTQKELLPEVDRAENTGESDFTNPSILPYKLDSSNPKSGDNPSAPVKPNETQKSGKETPPIPKGDWDWGIKILIGIIVVAGLAAIAALVVRVIKNPKKGEKTKK